MPPRVTRRKQSQRFLVPSFPLRNARSLRERTRVDQQMLPRPHWTRGEKTIEVQAHHEMTASQASLGGG